MPDCAGASLVRADHIKRLGSGMNSWLGVSSLTWEEISVGVVSAPCDIRSGSFSRFKCLVTRAVEGGAASKRGEGMIFLFLGGVGAFTDREKASFIVGRRQGQILHNVAPFKWSPPGSCV